MSYVYLTEENVKLQKKGGRYLVGRNLEVVMEIPEETLEGIVLIGRIQVSAEAMVSLLEQGIPVTWLSHTGILWSSHSYYSCGCISPAKTSTVAKITILFSIGKKIYRSQGTQSINSS